MHKLLNFILLFLLVLFSSFGQVNDVAYDELLHTLLSHTVEEVTVSKASNMMDSAIFIDAREPIEYKVSHLKNALPVGYDQFDLETVKNLPKNSNIIVYCSVGYRSEKIAEKFLKNGYSNVFNLYGGIFEWKNQGFQVYDSLGATEKIHAYNKFWGKRLNKGEKVY